MKKTEFPTSDPCITIASDLSEIALDLRSIQPKLFKRMTQKIKKRQAAYILDATLRLGFISAGDGQGS